MNWQNDKEMLGCREVGDQSPLIRPGSPTYAVPHRGEAIKDPENRREKEESSYKEPSPGRALSSAFWEQSSRHG